MSRYADVEKMPSGPSWDALNNKEKTTVLSFLIQLPTADVEEVRHGEIIKTGRRYPYCSVCNANLESAGYRRCPWCGAKMDKEKEKMSEKKYIDAEELNKLLCEAKNRIPVFNGGICKAQMIAREMPAADVEEVKYGKWIDTTEYCGEFTCSICKEMCVTNKYNYCPHCGARMDKE